MKCNRRHSESSSQPQCREGEDSLDLKGTLELKEILVYLEFQVLRVRWDMQAQRVRKDRKETKVIMDWMGRQVSGVARVQLAPEVSRDLRALERKVTEVLLVILGFLDLSDQKVHLEILGILGHQVDQVFRVSVARQGRLGLKVTEGLLDSKDLKVNRVTKVPEVCQVMWVHQVCRGHPETKDPKDQWDCLELMVPKDQEVTKDLLDPLDSEVLLGLPEMLELQERPGFKDHQGSQGFQDELALKVKRVKQEESSLKVAVEILLPSQDHPGLLVLPVSQDFQDYQVPLVLLVSLANLVLKVTGDSRESGENQE